jgi:hypothetical protein
MVVIVGAAFFWRLSQGPVSLDFMTSRIESEINKALPGMSVKLGGALFEFDNGTHVPHFRLRDLVIRDANGDLVAQSKRAALGFDRGQLLTGSLVPKSLELIGTRVLIKRQLDGSISLGFGAAAAPDAAQVVMEDGSDISSAADQGKVDRESTQPFSPEQAMKPLIEILSGANKDSAASSLSDIQISESSIQLFDEANQSSWFAPEADLTFKRMSYGFVVFAKATVASGPTTWHTEVSATYRQQNRNFSVSARIEDLVPANVSDKIFALAQFAKVNVPLSGHAEFEMSDAGVVSKATAEFAAAAGVIALPDYFAQPIVIDEGALRVDYVPETGGFNIVDSIVLIGGSRAELTGQVNPVRAADGKLTDIAVNLKATNVSVDAQGTVRDAVAVDKVEFSGKAAVEGAVLTIDDLVVMSGSSGVRLRGTITGGDQSAGIQVTGRIRDVSADLLKKLWPPVVGPKSRKWISENVQAGRISDGTFSVNIPVNGLAAATLSKQLPDADIDFTFAIKDVVTGYFKDLPVLKDGAGTAHLTGDNFDLTIDQGSVTLPSTGEVKVKQVTFHASQLLQEPAQGAFNIKISADANDLFEFATLPALNLARNFTGTLPAFSGDANASIDLSLPLTKDAPRDQVNMSATVAVDNAAIKQIVPKIDLTDGSLKLAMDKAGMTLSGPMKINGLPATVSWSKAAGAGTPSSATITTTLDDKTRDQLGIKLGRMVQGPVKLTANIKGMGTKTTSADVQADLSKAAFELSAIDWARPPTPDTSASFTIMSDPQKGRSINDLVVSGPGLSIKGDIDLTTDNGLKVAKLSQVSLSEDNNFAMTLRPGDGGQVVEIRGHSFDARPFLKSLFGSRPKSDPGSGQDLNLSVQLDRVLAHRGEIVNGVSAQIVVRNGIISVAEINGAYMSGLPLAVHLRTTDAGKQLEVNSADGGATLRAVNLYSKVAGGELSFNAQVMPGTSSSLQAGQLVIRNFEVRNEAALAELDQRGKPRKSGPRPDGLAFTKLTMPFTSDARFIRIGESLAKGNDLGAAAEGIIRKSDGAIDITGTIIPAYGLNSAVGHIPLFGQILTGGKGQGIFGVTFALGGTFAAPRFQFNPVSAIAPGIFRKFFEFEGPGQPVRPSRQNQH